ncbi:MAG TPA: nuclear transport factor 2 family protein [Moraxellaceae bacterium]|nr:nuclear transport factor 2 family protein [Moraxellaceae bacterium]
MTETQSVERVVRAFVQGLQEGNVPLLQQHLAREATINRYQGGRRESLAPDAWLATLAPRHPPEVAGLALQGIEAAGDVAHAYLCHVLDGHRYTCYLALEKREGAWKITSRSYHQEPASDAVAPGRQAA